MGLLNPLVSKVIFVIVLFQSHLSPKKDQKSEMWRIQWQMIHMTNNCRRYFKDQDFFVYSKMYLAWSKKNNNNKIFLKCFSLHFKDF